MKKLFALILVCVFVGFAGSAMAQTTIQLKVIGPQSSFEIPLKGLNLAEKQEFSYIFSQNSKYHLKIDRPQNKPVLVKLLDEKKNEIASNFVADKNKYFDNLEFNCPRTGMYYVTFQSME
jgi:hypothetical protein